METVVAARLRSGWVAAEVRGVSSRLPCEPRPVNRARFGYRGGVARPLVIAGCRRLCGWQETGRQLDGEPLFACSGCGSEWVPSQPWTPIDYEGVVPAPVAEARRTRGRG